MSVIGIGRAAGGWSFHLDGTYTLASPRTILAGVRTQVTIDGVLSDIGHPEVVHNGTHFWNTTTNKVVPPKLNDFGFIRLAVTAKSTSAPSNYFDVELDTTTGTFPIIFKETMVFSKGSGVAQSFNIVMPLFAGPDFVTNGGKIYITPDSDATFWEHGLTAVQTYSS
jgi:hypothetical protein